jgi:hypothetical protein
MTLEFGHRCWGVPKKLRTRHQRPGQHSYTEHATVSAIAFLLAIAGVPALAGNGVFFLLMLTFLQILAYNLVGVPAVARKSVFSC